MLFSWFVCLGVIAFAATFVLSFHGVIASENNTQGPHHLTECTQSGIFRCYLEYGSAFWSQLPRTDDGESNEEVYKQACRIFNKTSSCYEGSNRCAASMRSNFTRREEGYRAFRAMACDTEAFKGAMIAWNCTDLDKMRECIREKIGDINATGAEYEEIVCRQIPAQRVCYEKSRISSCPVSLKSTVVAVRKTLEATELMHDCKSTYRHESAPKASTGTEGSRSDAAAVTKLAVEVAEMHILLRENAQAVAYLADKVEKNAGILKHQMESIEGALHGLRNEFSRRCTTHSEAAGEQPSVVL